MRPRNALGDGPRASLDSAANRDAEMTFEDLILFEAVHDVYQEVENPRSSDWLMVEEKRDELCRLIRSRLPYDQEHLLRAWDQYGKSQKAEIGNELKKLALTVIVARTHGRRCFFANRGKGACSNDVSIDRIVPGSRGGRYTVENCVLVCGSHNSQRGDKSVEEYLF
jgi:hypothetical protein